MEKLRGLWDKLPSQIGDLIIKMIEDVEQAFEDGCLYIERYGEEDDYFESEDVNDYVFHFVNNLPDEMKIEYVETLREILNNSGYSTFMSAERKLSKIVKQRASEQKMELMWRVALFRKFSIGWTNPAFIKLVFPSTQLI